MRIHLDEGMSSPMYIGPSLRDIMVAAYLLRGYYQPAGPLIQHPSSKTQLPECVASDSAPSRSEEPAENPPPPPPPSGPPLAYSRPYPPYQGPYYPHGYYPPQPAHYQPPQPTSYHQHYHHHQDLCYPGTYPPGSYPPPPSHSQYRRYLPHPSASASGYHSPDITYSSSNSHPPNSSDSSGQQMVLPGSSSSYGPPSSVAPPPASQSGDHYPPPHPPSGYCPSYPSAPGPSCYPHPSAAPARNMPFLDTTYQSCPCPIQACPKNVHTGPLTGECKRPGAYPLPPVALSLPQEPPGAAGPPSPARGSDGGPALGAPASTWPNTSPGLPPGPPQGLLAISQTATTSLKKRKDRQISSQQKKKFKRSNENAGVDKKPPRKADPTVLKDRNTETPEVVETVLKCPAATTETVVATTELVDTTTVAAVPSSVPVQPAATVHDSVQDNHLTNVLKVIDDVAAGRLSCSPPPVLQPVRTKVKPRRRKSSPPPPTLQPAVDPPVLSLPTTKVVNEVKTASCKPLTFEDGSISVKSTATADKKGKSDKVVKRPSKAKVAKLTPLEIQVAGCEEELQAPAPPKAGRKAVSLPARPVKEKHDEARQRRRQSASKRPRKLSMPARLSALPRWSNGWAWDGKPFDAKVYLNNDDAPVPRRCYPAMRHTTAADVIRPRDCVLLKSGARKDLPYVAKVAALYEDPLDGEMMMSLLWYYRPEHTDQGRRPTDHTDEIFASRHKDSNSVACIEDKCFVLTFNEYCRYRKRVRASEMGYTENSVMPRSETYPWNHRQPPSIMSADLVFFCRKVYDFRQKRLLKNPS